MFMPSSIASTSASQQGQPSAFFSDKGSVASTVPTPPSTLDSTPATSDTSSTPSSSLSSSSSPQSVPATASVSQRPSPSPCRENFAAAPQVNICGRCSAKNKKTGRGRKTRKAPSPFNSCCRARAPTSSGLPYPALIERVFHRVGRPLTGRKITELLFEEFQFDPKAEPRTRGVTFAALGVRTLLYLLMSKQI